MRILITNDDGINSVGLNTIAEILNEKHEVYVIAPTTQRSATGHGISIHSPIAYTRLSSDKYSLRIATDGPATSTCSSSRSSTPKPLCLIP